MTDRVTASFMELFEQGSDTAASYLARAKRHIDQLFGDGFAKAKPSLVAAFMNVAVTGFSAGSNGKIFGSALDGIAQALEEIAESLRGQE